MHHHGNHLWWHLSPPSREVTQEFMTLRTHGSVVSWTVGVQEQTRRPSGLRPSQPRAATSAPQSKRFWEAKCRGLSTQAFRGLTARGHGQQLMGREGVSADSGLVGPPHNSLRPPSPGFAPGRPAGPLSAPPGTVGLLTSASLSPCTVWDKLGPGPRDDGDHGPPTTGWDPGHGGSLLGGEAQGARAPRCCPQGAAQASMQSVELMYIFHTSLRIKNHKDLI